MTQENLELELTVLTSMLCYKDDARFFNDQLEVEDFASPKNRKLFTAMCGITEEHGEVLVPMLRPVLGDTDFWYLKDLVLTESISVNPQAHAQKLIEHRLLREMDQLGTDMSKDARQPRVVYNELHAKYEQRLSKLGLSRWESMDVLFEIVPEMIDDVEQTHRIVSRGGKPGVSTGLIDQDDIIQGFRPADFIVTAARPGMGKTALMLFEALALGEQGIPVGIFSLEMAQVELTKRMLACDSRLMYSHIRDGTLRGEEWSLFNESAAKISRLPIYITDEPDADMNKISQIARRAVADHGIKVFYIDYLQLIRGERGIKRWEAVSMISHKCKALAKELMIPVVALAQLNRDCETRNVKNKRPILADLRESGAIEQDADLVRFLYRHCQYDDDTPHLVQHVLEIDVKKHRNGRTGICKIGFWAEYQRFGDVDAMTTNQYQDYIKDYMKGKR